MADFYVRRDIQAATAFTHADALFDFGFEADAQFVFNESGSAIIEYSFDGVNVHGRVSLSGPTSAKGLGGHKRRKLWCRAVTPPGACFVQVEAVTK